jgi:thioredoxin reductase
MRYDLIILGETPAALDEAVDAARQNRLVAVVREPRSKDAWRQRLAEEGIDDFLGGWQGWSDGAVMVRESHGGERILTGERIVWST